MNFFKRLMLKLEQAADRKRARREGEQVAENTFRTPVIDQSKVAPAPVAVQELPVRNVEDPEDPSVPPELPTLSGNTYLAKYTDVAMHPYFGIRPQRHYQFFGAKEGRIWESPVYVAPATPAPKVSSATGRPLLTMPSGRTFPVPVADKENNLGYMYAVAAHLGRMEEWNRLGMGWTLAADGIMQRLGILSPDRGAWAANPVNWPVLAEEHWFPDKSKGQAPDTQGWAKWAETVQQRPKDEPPAPLTQTEIPL